MSGSRIFRRTRRTAYHRKKVLSLPEYSSRHRLPCAPVSQERGFQNLRDEAHRPLLRFCPPALCTVCSRARKDFPLDPPAGAALFHGHRPGYGIFSAAHPLPAYGRNGHGSAEWPPGRRRSRRSGVQSPAANRPGPRSAPSGCPDFPQRSSLSRAFQVPGNLPLSYAFLLFILSISEYRSRSPPGAPSR